VLLATEPIEKKYLFHFLPGGNALSLGTPGCNLGCDYCINWRVSQRGVEEMGTPLVAPDAVVAQAVAAGVEVIAFTYTEPTIFIEYARDIACRAREAGLAVAAKSNGYMAPGVLAEMASWLDGINIDLKGWPGERHRQVVRGAATVVLDNLRRARRLGLWLEVSTLLTPGLNTDDESLRAMTAFIAAELGVDTPWHVQRFFPHYKMTARPVTSQRQLETAIAWGREAGLRYVYNKELGQGRLFDTVCPTCQTVVVAREGFEQVDNRLNEKGECPQCRQPVDGVFASIR
jgi:pyruvate formate lyase activating enzyme